MAAVQSLRLCGRACRHGSAPRRIATHIPNSRRTLSSTPAWRDTSNKRGNTEDKGPRFEITSNKSKRGELMVRFDETSNTIKVAPPRRSDKVLSELQAGLSEEYRQRYQDILTFADQNKLDPGPRRKASRSEIKKAKDQAFEMFENNDRAGLLDDVESSMKELDEWATEVNRPVLVRRDSFWGEDEEDQDLLTEDMDDDVDFGENDIMSLAHGKLEEHREFREYARVAAWQMPLLSKLARPYVPPTAEECLRFRYTTYMGENHPAQSKVVVEFSPRDLPLNEAQQLKLKKLLGPRWNPETDIVKMSCEQFDHQAQNKRYLGDLVQTLIAKAKDPTDMFEDVPLDTRHHKIKVKPKFPKEWRLTQERIKEIEDARQKSLLLDESNAAAGRLVDGTAAIDKHFYKPDLATLAAPTPAYVNARPSPPPSRPAPRMRRV